MSCNDAYIIIVSSYEAKTQLVLEIRKGFHGTMFTAFNSTYEKHTHTKQHLVFW